MSYPVHPIINVPKGKSLRVRKGTSQQWISYDPILKPTDLGFNTETKVIKLGDGVHKWSELTALNGGDSDGLSDLVEALDNHVSELSDSVESKADESDLTDHIEDSTGAHAASAISVEPLEAYSGADDMQTLVGLLAAAIANEEDARTTADNTLDERIDDKVDSSTLSIFEETTTTAIDSLNDDMSSKQDKASLATDGATLFNPSKLSGLGFKATPQRLVASTDTATVVTNGTIDVAFNRSYVRGTGAYPANYPIDVSGVVMSLYTGGYEYQSAPAYTGQTTRRIMSDGDAFAFYQYAPALTGFMIYVDGAPLSLTPYTFSSAGIIWSTVTFAAGAKTRLIEIVTDTWFYGVYVKKPYKAWKPDPAGGPTVLVVGDSYVTPVVYNNTGTTTTPIQNYGAIQGLAPLLGLSNILTDGVSGSGFIQGVYNFRARLATDVAFDPDVFVVFGGVGNDKLVGGQTDAAIIAVATTYFQNLRAALPNAKLVYMESILNPTFNAYNASFIAVRTALQAALTDVGVYYIDVATTDPWINGTGYVNHTPGTENSGIYIGDDGTHPTILGHRYIRERLAPKLRRVLRDRGALVNTLI